ncbi:unnamed protein product [Prorocentrum cordatum]|uniref:Cyclic nucleotide-binding domain-containing protein n=1 Tax=Prorocentrum cordatum TaxID=2364126 RepID=A0ABN9T5V1_9DINO|nr:unnamed protein product [Polarella glacialis]
MPPFSFISQFCFQLPLFKQFVQQTWGESDVSSLSPPQKLLFYKEVLKGGARQDAAREQRRVTDQLPAAKSESKRAKLRQRLRRLVRSSRLWAPFDRRLQLIGVRPGNRILTDQLEMQNVIDCGIIRGCPASGTLFAMATDCFFTDMEAGRALRLLRFLPSGRIAAAQDAEPLAEAGGAGRAGVALQAIHSLEFLNSEYVLTTLRVAKLMVMIIVINHFVACSWYGIASMLGDERSWVNVHFSSSDDLAYRYGTSLHWSLTQFTPASMEVFPTNSRERAFNVCVVIFALLTFSSFISSITEAMTSIRKINGRRNMQYASMRQYLRENRVSMQLAVRVRHYLQQSERARQTRRVWRDVELFQELPEVLQMELRYEVYARLIARHPFFHQYGELDPSAMKALCHRAVREVPLVSGQELFGPGQVADRMYFVVDGSLSYDFQGFGSSEEHLLDDASPLVSGGQWFAEAAVWVRWFHLGSMVAKTPSLVLALDVTKLHVVMAQYVDTLPHCRRYAQLFAENARCRLPPLSDVCSGFDDCQDTAQRAFEEGRKRRRGRRLGQRVQRGVPAEPRRPTTVLGQRGLPVLQVSRARPRRALPAGGPRGSRRPRPSGAAWASTNWRSTDHLPRLESAAAPCPGLSCGPIRTSRARARWPSPPSGRVQRLHTAVCCPCIRCCRRAVEAPFLLARAASRASAARPFPGACR